MFFWNSLAFLMIQRMLAIWSLGPLPFLNPAWTSGSSRITYCWPVLENVENYFALLWDWNENWPSPVLCWVFQVCWHIECSTFTASSSRIWNSSTGMPSPPWALFVVMLSKAHLTSHSGMSGSRWVITPSWYSGSLRSVLHSSSMYSCHLFLISSASVRPCCFCPLLWPSLHEMFPMYLWFSWRDL